MRFEGRCLVVLVVVLALGAGACTPSDPPDQSGTDADGDGYVAEVDCDDGDPLVHPDATDTPGDGIDQDCDGTDGVQCYIDADGDQFGANPGAVTESGVCPDGQVTKGEDCDDSDPAVHPEAEEIPDNELDEDCDGEV